MRHPLNLQCTRLVQEEALYRLLVTALTLSLKYSYRPRGRRVIGSIEELPSSVSWTTKQTLTHLHTRSLALLVTYTLITPLAPC